MSRTDSNLSETDIRSEPSKTRAVRANSRDRRRWLAGEPVCPLLKQYHIVHVDVFETLGLGQWERDLSRADNHPYQAHLLYSVLTC